MYLQLESYTQYFPIQPFHDGAQVIVPEEEIELKQENIEIPKDFIPQDVKSFAKDVNDPRKQSDKDYFKNKSASEVEQEVKDYEKKLFEEAGGKDQRKKIEQEMEERKRKEKENASNKKKEENTQKGGDTGFKGRTMVHWDLTNRTEYQNNEWWVRNPGYTCGPGMNGIVVVIIKVNQNGNVISAKYDPSQSSGAYGCMIEQAEKYAKLSRFNYSSSAPASQTGKIIYTFVSQ